MPVSQLSVITWNIHGCRGGLGEIADELRTRNADVIFLQEAEVNPPGSTGVHQPRLIAQRLGMNCYSAGSPMEMGGEQHMAILARPALRNTIELDAGTGRIYGVAAEIAAGKRTMHVVCVHLTSSYKVDLTFLLHTSANRTREVADLGRRVKQWGGDVIISGDFNMPPGTSGFEPLAAVASCRAAGLPTYPASGPAIELDYFFSNLPPVGDVEVLQSTRSDHLPVKTMWKID